MVGVRRPAGRAWRATLGRRLRRQVHQHADRREPPRVLPGGRARDVPVGAAAARAGDAAGAPVPARSSATAFPISFSAGIDAANFADAVALGLVPVTVCTDLLKPGGYARCRGYFDELRRAHGRRRRRAASTSSWSAASARAGRRSTTLGAGRARRHARASRRWRAGAPLRAGVRRRALRAVGVGGAAAQHGGLRRARRCATRATPRAANRKPPRKIGRHLQLFDCITCDKCVPVCPNDANFTFVLPRCECPS